MVEYLDKKLYNKVKKMADEKYKKHSAYKSMFIIDKYEELGGKLRGKRKNNLGNWREEKWLNLTPYAMGLVKNIKDSPLCGVKHPKQKNPSICRPSKKVDKDTPKKLASDFNKKQLMKAVNIKKNGNVIKWNDL
jgi:hypothetical protein